MTFAHPILLASRCLGFEACRWNGQCLPDPVIEALRPFVTFETTCPEYEIGLGVPREPIRLVRAGESIRLMQPATGRDVTPEMEAYIERLLAELPAVDGFLLKFGSPTCGMTNVKLYASCEKGAMVGKTRGLFGAAVLTRFLGYPIEDEGRLHNFTLREHFYTALFTLAEFREIRAAALAAKKIAPLVAFQSRHKLLLMSYDQERMRALGRLSAEAGDLSERFAAYERLLREALAYPARYTNVINALQHALGYFKSKVSPAEKAHLLERIEQYRRAKLPLSVPLAILRGWALRFEESYLLGQSLFNPYPEALVEITDSGKGRGL